MRVINIAFKFAGLLSSFIFLTVGSIVLIRTMSLDVDTVIYALKLAVFGAVIAGFLGYSIGKIFSAQRRKISPRSAGKINKNADLLIDDILIRDLDKISKNIE